MPNWCHNRVRFTGTTEDITNLMEFVQDQDGEHFSFDSIIPIPEENHTNWYDWSVANWVTKWNVSEVDMITNEHDSVVTYYFDTAWNPPTPIYNVLKEKYPEVYISWFYDEPGMEFSGYLPN